MHGTMLSLTDLHKKGVGREHTFLSPQTVCFFVFVFYKAVAFLEKKHSCVAQLLPKHIVLIILVVKKFLLHFYPRSVFLLFACTEQCISVV